MQLATISGVNGPYTDEDFARVRAAALAALPTWAPPEPGKRTRTTRKAAT
jgi:hypothetical protein